MATSQGLPHASRGGPLGRRYEEGFLSPTAVVKLPQHALELLHLLLQERPHFIRLGKELGAALPAQLSAADIPEQVPEAQERPQPFREAGGQDPGGGRPRLCQTPPRGNSPSNSTAMRSKTRSTPE